jgi:CRP-like cAMP-binding protein
MFFRGGCVVGSSVAPLGAASSKPICPLALKFKGLGIEGDALDLIVRAIKRRVRVTAGDGVVCADNTVKHVTLLSAGVTCSYKRSEDGGRTIHAFHHPGDFCDLSRYVLPERDDAVGVQALTDCSVCIIDYRDLEQLLARPELALALWRATMLEAAIYRERLTVASRGSALERVAHLLCEQLARREAVGIASNRLPLSQIDIADASGLSPVHVNRTIQTLRCRSLLSRASTIEAIDRKQLARIGKFDGHYLNTRKLLSNWTVRV